MPQSLQEWAGAGPDGKATLALVFTDIVASTDLANDIGDKRWFDVIKAHFANARRFKDEFRGYEIKLIGDAYMVAFKTADQAFQFAWRFYHNTGDALIKIRIGVNVGQVRIVDNDLLGIMVNYTSRVQHELRHQYGILLSDSARTDIVNEFGAKLPGCVLQPIKRSIKSFGEKKLWFVSRPITKGKNFFRKAVLNDFDLLPPIPGADELKK
ncbi:MAG TPA: adenylate/guanylate cyclase domain-containing protein [Pyrinomonadaceae bacterium]|jgi:class 3 adenylate cyclase